MRITEITDQHRRDFRANVECESCGAKDKISGYDVGSNIISQKTYIIKS